MKKYSWIYNINADAQKVGEELELIEREGSISPVHLIEYAERHKDSELYKCFEWDNDEAAKKYRLRQATTIIGSISVEIKEEPREIQKVYYSINDSKTNEKKFKNISEIINNDDEYLQIVEKAKSEFIKCKHKYESLLEKEDLKDVIFDIYREI